MPSRRRTRNPPGAPWRRSIDAAHPVDGDLLDQQLVDVLLGQLLDVVGVLVFSQHPDLLWARTQPIAGPGLPRLSGALCPRPREALATAPGAAPGIDPAPRLVRAARGSLDAGLRRWDRPAGWQPPASAPDHAPGSGPGGALADGLFGGLDEGGAAAGAPPRVGGRVHPAPG